MSVKKEFLLGFLLGLCIVRSEDFSLSATPSSPCPEIFRFEEVSKDSWQAKLTLLSENDLHGVWVRLLTDTKMADLVVPKGFDVKYDEGPEVRITNREYFLDANTPKSFIVGGKLIDGKAPELLKVIFNGEAICTSHKLSGNSLYAGDFNSKHYYSSIVQSKSNKNISKSTQCGEVPFNQIVFPSYYHVLKYNQYPWHAAVFSRDSPSTLLCQATLISDDSLLTSAHCVVWQKSRRPISGYLLLVKLKYTQIDEGNQDLLQVENVIIHPEFNEKNLDNDIAIIKLEKPLKIDNNTLPVCLPNSERRFDFGFVLGYGFNEYGNWDRLRITALHELTSKNCVAMEPLYKTLMNDNNFCAVYEEETENCIGSSGSGYYSFLAEPWMAYEIVGVVSIGRSLHEKLRCNSSAPVVVVDVYKYVKWIKSNIN